MKPRRLTLLTFWATAAFVLLTIIVLTLVIIAAYSQMAGAQGKEESPQGRIRVEMFGWRLNEDTLIWSVSTGRENDQGDYESAGEPKTLAWRIGSNTIIYDEAEHKVTAEWQEHLEETFNHLLYDLYKTSVPSEDGPGEEAKPVRARAKL